MDTSPMDDFVDSFPKNVPFEQFVKQVILKAFDTVKTLAETHTLCKRKGCGCTILEIGESAECILHYTAINGPSTNRECTNIIGACGCSHAEPRAIMKYLKGRRFTKKYSGTTILLTTYSPCINCANIILDSGVIDFVAYEHLALHWASPAAVLSLSVGL